MSIRFFKIAMMLALALLFFGALAAGGSAFFAFIRQEPPRRAATSTAAPRIDDLKERIQPLNDYSSIWRMKCCPGDNAAEPVRTVEIQQTDRDKVVQIIRGLFGISGIICNRTKPADSYAVLKLLKENNANKTVSPGEVVSGAKVEEIGPNSVMFSYSGFSVDLSMTGGFSGAGAGVGFAPPGTQLKPGPGGPGPVDPAAGMPGVAPDGAITNPAQAFPNSRRINPTQWQIEAAEIQYVQTNQSRIINEVRPALHVGADGKTDGVEVKQVPNNSLAASRGFEQGDVIKSINNIPVDSLDFDSLGQRLKNAKTITVQVERRGRPVTLTFTPR